MHLLIYNAGSWDLLISTYTGCEGGFMLYLIQGCFFQKRKVMAIGYQPGGMGEVAMLDEETMRSLYFGVIYPAVPGDDMSDELAGQLNDVYGQSVLSDIKIEPGIIEFSKRYVHRSDLVHYKFELKAPNPDGTGTYWAGHYSGERTGRGVSNCIITDVPDDFFEYDISAVNSDG